MKHLLPGLLILLLFACNRKVNAPEPPPRDLGRMEAGEILPQDSFPAVDIKPELEEIPLYVLAEIKRTPCYGHCPAFNAKIYSDGRIEYEGLEDVNNIGKYQTTISSAQIEQIYQAAERANYFVLKNNYPRSGRFMRDLPMTTTYLKRGGLEKRIHNNFDAPRDLIEYEDWLINFLHSLRWTKVDP